MRTPHLLAVGSLALLFATPTVSAQALAEKALTTIANPASALSHPHVHMPGATVPGTSAHSYSARHTNVHHTGGRATAHATAHRSNTRNAHPSSHITYRRIQ